MTLLKITDFLKETYRRSIDNNESFLPNNFFIYTLRINLKNYCRFINDFFEDFLDEEPSNFLEELPVLYINPYYARIKDKKWREIFLILEEYYLNENTRLIGAELKMIYQKGMSPKDIDIIRNVAIASGLERHLAVNSTNVTELNPKRAEL